MIFSFLQAASAGSGQMLMQLMPIILIIVIFYIFLIVPQNKKQKETQRMLNELKKGDKVVTIGGIYGTVFAADEKTVVLTVDDGVRIKFQKAAVSSLIVENQGKKEAASAKKGIFASLFGKKNAEQKAQDEKPAENSESDEAK